MESIILTLAAAGITLALVAIVGALAVLKPPRIPRPQSAAQLRREWTQARPHWPGADGWEGRE